MLPDEHKLALQAAARAVRDRLRDMMARWAEGRVQVQPSELTTSFGRSMTDDWRGPALFNYMACTVVADKYIKAGHRKVALAIERRREIALTAIGAHARLPTWEEQHANDKADEWLITSYRRLGNHRSRISYSGDPDLHVCRVGWLDDFGNCATPWVFQQDDLRYRWTPLALHKLRYLADCWDAYSRCDFTLADATIGLADFPLSDRLRAEPSPLQ